MKSILKQICLSGVAFIGLSFLTAAAAPLPAGTKLAFTKGAGGAPGVPCTGSCFSMEVAPGFVVWTDFGPGTDGGFIVGKAQKCGGQEISPSAANSTPGELTAAWLFAGNYGTWCTDPGGEQNLFSDTSCAGAGCLGNTDLKYFYMAWNTNKIPLGSAEGCLHANCTPEQKAGIFVREWTYNADGKFTLDYSTVVSSRDFLGLKMRFRFVNNSSPSAQDIALTVGTYSIASWQPSAADANGDPLTCRIVTPPAHGVVSVKPDCSGGAYAPTTGYVGPDSFTYVANDRVADSNIATVSINVLSEPAPTPSPGTQLPAGTRLGFTQGVGSAPNISCNIGSCFGMEVAPGFVVWTDFGPGSDGGFIVGKAQKCGPQEIGPSSSVYDPSELTAAWFFFGNYGTFCTDPGGEQNSFSSGSCSGIGCIGKTELRYFYAAWNGTKIPLGSSTGCAHPNCSDDQRIGIFVSDYQIGQSTWSMRFNQVVPSTQFVGVKFSLITRGPVSICTTCAIPIARDVNMEGPSGTTLTWLPNVSDPDGSRLLCRIGTPPANGTADVATDCSSGAYTSKPGFIGLDVFTYTASNEVGNMSAPGTVTVAVTDPTSTPTPSVTPSATPTATPPPSCVTTHPVTQLTRIGKQGTLRQSSPATSSPRPTRK